MSPLEKVTVGMAAERSVTVTLEIVVSQPGRRDRCSRKSLTIHRQILHDVRIRNPTT